MGILIYTGAAVSNLIIQTKRYSSIVENEYTRIEKRDYFIGELKTTLKMFLQTLSLVNIGGDSSKTGCVQPLEVLKAVQGFRLGGRIREMVLWWDSTLRDPPVLPTIDEKLPYISNLKDTLHSNIRRMETFNSNSRNQARLTGYQSFADAVSRCNESSLTSQAPPLDIFDQKDIYLCGFGEDFIIEVNILLWDFLQDQPIACKALPDTSGRGLHVRYHIHFFSKIYSGGKYEYFISNFKDLIYITKDVSEQGYLKQLWK